MSNPQHLIHTIQQAFSGVTLGNGIGLSEGNAILPARFPYCRPTRAVPF